MLAPLVYAAILYLYWPANPRGQGGVAYLVFGFTMALFAVKALQELVVQAALRWFFDRISIFARALLVRSPASRRLRWRVCLIVCGVIMTAAIARAACCTGRYSRHRRNGLRPLLPDGLHSPLSATALSLRSQTARAERLAGRTRAARRIRPTRCSSTNATQRSSNVIASSTPRLLTTLDATHTPLLADRFGIARSRELLSRFHSRIRDYIQWGYELDTAEAAALTNSYSKLGTPCTAPHRRLLRQPPHPRPPSPTTTSLG